MKWRIALIGLVVLSGCSEPPINQPPVEVDANADIKRRVREVQEKMARGEKVPIPGTPKVKYIRHKVKPFITANGQDAKMIYVTWKSIGTAPVNSVFADLIVLDESGEEILSTARDYCIFSADDSAPAKPGSTVTDAEGEGYVLLPLLGNPAKVNVRITRCE